MFCTNCGSKITDGIYCRKCGARIDAKYINGSGDQLNDLSHEYRQTAFSTDMKSFRTSNTKKILFAIATVIACVFAIIFFSNINTINPEKALVGTWSLDEQNSNEDFAIIRMHKYTTIKFYSDGGISARGNVMNDLDSWTIVDDTLKWQEPLGTTHYFGFSCDGKTLKLINERGLTATYIKIK